MAIARVLVAGILVAGGIVLGAFTALGYLDPEWTQNQLAAAAKREPAAEHKSISAFRRTRFVATESETSPQPKPPLAKAAARSKTEAAPAERKHFVKTAARKKAADRARESARPQQQAAVFQWPWKLFGN